MFIRSQVINGRIYYSVVEHYKPKGKQGTLRIIAPLGQEKSLRAAYEKEIKQLKKSQDKIARLEKAIAVIGIDARYGEPSKINRPGPQLIWSKLDKAIQNFCVAMYASESVEEKAEIGQEFAELLGANGFYEYCRTVKENEGEDGNTTLPE